MAEMDVRRDVTALAVEAGDEGLAEEEQLQARVCGFREACNLRA